MNRVSQVWWIPLARRVLGWGAAGALLWALPVAALIGSMAPYVHLHPSPPEPEEFVLDGNELVVGLLVWLCILSSSAFALMGAIVGWFAAFYAPTKDGKNPLKSRFFRLVGRQTFWFTAATSLACGLTFGVLLYPVSGFLLAFIGWFAISIALFFLGLWRAINRARDAATASDYSA